MPELPEVQTVVTELHESILNSIIKSCHVLRSNVLNVNEKHFAERMIERRIVDVTRKGKFILFRMDPPGYLIAHLKMTGKFIVASKYRSHHPHDRVFFILDDNRKLIFNDVRCFGRLGIYDDIDAHPGLGKLGWEPWNNNLTSRNLRHILKRKDVAIKNLLLDQSVIAGIGNIYASEILFDARISPSRKSKALSLRELEQLIRSTRSILKKAIVHNGTSISDYTRVDEKTGDFQNFLKVYGKAGSKCVGCGHHTISKIKQNQRSTFLCHHCQK